MSYAEKKRSLVLWGVAFIFLCGALWKIFSPHEPVYEGKPLHYWLEACSPGKEHSSEAEQKFNEVMNSVGTNAIPTLLSLLRERDSGARKKWNAFLKWLQDEYAVQTSHPLAWEINYEGFIGFEKLGGRASNAVPALIKIYEQNISSNSRSGAIMALGAIGPSAEKAVPVLTSWLESKDKDQTSVILDSLGQIHCDPDVVVPLLMKHLTASSSHTRSSAAKALGEYGPEGRPAVSLLLNSLQDENELVRDRASNALLRIDPAALGRATEK